MPDVSTLSVRARNVYDAICATPGCDAKHLQTATELHGNALPKPLRVLEETGFIYSIRGAKNKGGPFYRPCADDPLPPAPTVQTPPLSTPTQALLDRIKAEPGVLLRDLRGAGRETSVAQRVQHLERMGLVYRTGGASGAPKLWPACDNPTDLRIQRPDEWVERMDGCDHSLVRVGKEIGRVSTRHDSWQARTVHGTVTVDADEGLDTLALLKSVTEAVVAWQDATTKEKA